MDREKVFADVLDKKEAIKDYKNNRERKTQNLNFSKGKIVLIKKLRFHRFDKKIKISSTLIFSQNRLRKSIWEHSS